MLVDRARYEHGYRVDGAAPTADGPKDGSSFVWVGLADPTPAEIEAVADEFSLHPLAVEDAIHAHQRPKIEHYGDNWFVVLKTVRYVEAHEDVTLGEVMAFVADDFIVTVRHGDSTAVGQVRRSLEAHEATLAAGPWAVLHQLTDRVVDDYESVVRHVEDLIAGVQHQVFERPSATHGATIFRLKREVLEFRQAVAPLQPALELLADLQRSPAPPERRPYFRNVLDHLLRVNDRIRTLDDLLTSALNVNVSQVGMRQNEDMRKISAWVAIVAVPTMVAGIYGMNFEHMPELQWRWAYPSVLGLTVLACFGLYRNFKHRNWL
jgi:magnesium transporter